MNAEEIVGVFSHKCLFARSTIFVWNQTLIDSEKSSFVGSMPSREISEFTFQNFNASVDVADLNVICP